mmetsp:Transcript_122520/g.381381  ORF Transcript_122520/g.381381 Transcript_122520/m.381381 type:complete len:143 (+) Transcript_122520:301-729(+)
MDRLTEGVPRIPRRTVLEFVEFSTCIWLMNVDKNAVLVKGCIVLISAAALMIMKTTNWKAYASRRPTKSGVSSVAFNPTVLFGNCTSQTVVGALPQRETLRPFSSLFVSSAEGCSTSSRADASVNSTRKSGSGMYWAWVDCV